MSVDWVGIDGRNLSLAQGTGVATYARGLAETLSGLGYRLELLGSGTGRGTLADTPFTFLRRAARAAVIRECRGILAPDDAAPPFSRTRSAPDIFRLAQMHLRLGRGLLRLSADTPPDIMHWSYPLPIHVAGTVNVYTIHDLIPMTAPEHSGIPGRAFKRLAARIAERADHIVTVSEHSRQEIIRLLGCKPEKVTNTYQSVHIPRSILEEPPGILSPWGPAGPPLAPHGYFLFVGSVEPRKNVARLIKAYMASGTRVPLIIAGPDGWRAEEELAPGTSILAAEARQAGLRAGKESMILRTGYLDRGALLRMIKNARALFMPSLSEGFGIPALEAMMLGTPVMASRHGALSEIVAEGGLCVDAHDTGALARAIADLAASSALGTELSQAGRQRASVFSPEAYRSRLQRLYNDL